MCEGTTKTMKCADERGFLGEGDTWPEREFVEDSPGDWRCTECGWLQVSFAHGCRELILSAIWHDEDSLAEYIREVRKANLPIDGTIRVEIGVDFEPGT